MRSVAEITAIVKELAHDRTGKTYPVTLTAARIVDAFRDLVDRILRDPLACKCLLTEGDAVTVASQIDLPTDCARLVRMEKYDTDQEEWIPLRSNRRGVELGGEGTSPRSATFEALGQVLSDYLPLTWRPAADGNSVYLWPNDATGSVRFVYLRRPAFPAGTSGTFDLPDGADELVEFLAADKLIAMEPQDQKRIQTYASYFAARFQTWREGVGAGRVDRAQRYVAEVGE